MVSSQLKQDNKNAEGTSSTTSSRAQNLISLFALTARVLEFSVGFLVSCLSLRGIAPNFPYFNEYRGVWQCEI